MALEYYFRYPFAISGDKTPIADVIQPDGTVSWQQGYSVDYQLDPTTNPLAKNIDRLTYNGSLYQITRALQEYQQVGNPDWITPAQNGGTPFAYPLNAVVRYDDGTGVKIYRNTVAGNTDAPDVAGWVDAAGTALSGDLPLVNGVAAAGVATTASRADHVHPTDASRAPLASPALTGTPTTTTPTAGDNSTRIASTAFVMAAIAAAKPAYDIPFIAGFGLDFSAQDLVVGLYGTIILPRSVTFESVVASIGTASAGAAVQMDILKNGSSIFSVLPSFAAGSSTLTAGTFSSTAAISGDRLDFRIAQIGSVVPGQQVRFSLKGRES